MEKIKKYKIQGLPDNHLAQVDFDIWMHNKVCPKCGSEYKLFTFNTQECGYCHGRQPFIERWKYYESKGNRE